MFGKFTTFAIKKFISFEECMQCEQSHLLLDGIDKLHETLSDGTQ